MPVFFTYRCGCQEERARSPQFPVCPMHGEPATRAVAASPAALEVAYGPQLPTPAGGRFYPAISGLV